ncbi:hypothetical protein PCASD_12610 [Puccinia coronata f. sp. avenae]|uniref:Uncharacterized protein n=1 Tax=Puccinia coronata f. sp. avenae TaxID=200324 RepID=A0A2N5TE09_9BASI|nr:hypothetical protein PCASD_12610 [Puccinia coronata f. sp. avenae]
MDHTYQSAFSHQASSANDPEVSRLRAELAQRDDALAQVLERVALLEASSKKTPKKATPVKSNPHIWSSPNTLITPRGQSSAPTTPASGPSSSKKNPHQMIMKNQPADFERTKEAFYIHIKLLWGLVTQHAVPTSPDPTFFTKFHQRFSRTKEITQTLQTSGSPPLISESQIQTLRDAKCGCVKIGKGILHISEFFLEYMWATMAKIGFCQWAPDLDSQPDSLYNEACHMSAILTFRKAVVIKVYLYMSINKAYAKDIPLLQDTYNHYVHYYLAQIYAKEKKEVGKHLKDKEKKVIQGARQRLAKAQKKFGQDNGLPKQYQQILNNVQAHSDEEYYAKQDVYIVKKMPFRSHAANMFMRCINDQIKKQNELEGKQVNTVCRCIRVKNPPKTAFPKAPKGLPIDFYDAEWYNDKLPAQRMNLANSNRVAFLPNPLFALTSKGQADEKLTDAKFAEKHWSRATKDYDLSHLKAALEEEEES